MNPCLCIYDARMQKKKKNNNNWEEGWVIIYWWENNDSSWSGKVYVHVRIKAKNFMQVISM